MNHEFAGISLKLLKLIKWMDKDGKVQKFCLVDKVTSRWESFGYLLDIPQDKLDSWKVECLGDLAKCWIKVMNYWLVNSQILDNPGDKPEYPATWEGLYEMLEDVEYAEVAKELREAVTLATRSLSFSS